MTSNLLKYDLLMESKDKIELHFISRYNIICDDQIRWNFARNYKHNHNCQKVFYMSSSSGYCQTFARISFTSWAESLRYHLFNFLSYLIPYLFSLLQSLFQHILPRKQLSRHVIGVDLGTRQWQRRQQNKIRFPNILRIWRIDKVWLTCVKN